jgi:hypothetical protein
MIASNYTSPAYLTNMNLYEILYVRKFSQSQSQEWHKKPYEIVNLVYHKVGIEAGTKRRSSPNEYTVNSS